MKKLLIFLICAFLLIGCTSNSTDEVNSNSKQDATESKDKADTNDKKENEEKQTESENESEKVESSKDTTIEEKVLIDQEGIKITVIGLDMKSSIWGQEIKLLIENDSNQNIMVQSRDMSVNGFMIEPIFSCDVAQGKKANATIGFESSVFDANGIKDIATIELKFAVSDADTWNEIFKSDVVVIDTSSKGTYNQEYDDSGAIIYDDNGIKIVSKGVSIGDSIFGPEIKLYIENNTDKNITVQARDVSLNGFMIDCTMSSDVCIGKKSNTSITFFSDDLEANNIIDIEDAELKFHIFNAESWDSIVDTDIIKITF